MCELDIIFNFEKVWFYFNFIFVVTAVVGVDEFLLDLSFCLRQAYYVLDELILGGQIQETSKNTVLKAIAQQDLVQEVRWNFFYCISVFFEVRANIWNIMYDEYKHTNKCNIMDTVSRQHFDAWILCFVDFLMHGYCVAPTFWCMDFVSDQCFDTWILMSR